MKRLAINKSFASRGFTLIETLISVAIFSIFAFGIYFSYFNILDVVTKTRVNALALNAVEKEMEVVRNLPYTNIGIVGGFPPGVIQAQKTVVANGASFLIKSYVRSVDDPFDGVASGTPNDLSPADYKIIEMEISCATCPNLNPISITSNIAPRNLESASTTGSLFINVFDALGTPIYLSDVNVVNNILNPNISITDNTNTSGILQLVGIPTSTASYQISVSKSGYSSDQTYTPGASGNPNPLKPHATVASNQVTSISFIIDKVSAINLSTKDVFCSAIPDIDYTLSGTKLIGQSPDVLKYSASSTTNGSGLKTISNLEWDTYSFQNNDSAYDVSGTNPLQPIVLNPNSTFNFNWIMDAKNPLAALITVQNSSGTLLNDALVTLSKGTSSYQRYTNRRSLTETSWSGDYTLQSGGVEDANPSGEIKLKDLGGGVYSTSTEWLISKTFDFGANDTIFYNLSWNPTNEPIETGTDSLQIQIASNNDNATWDFLGPDGTTNTFYTSSTIPINSHNNHRYLRYKVYLKTANSAFTPRLSDIAVSFASLCTPAGQTFLNGLSSGTYTIKIEKPGYQTLTDTNFSVTKNWQEYKATLNP